jgi:hypothetical protein
MGMDPGTNTSMLFNLGEIALVEEVALVFSPLK